METAAPRADGAIEGTMQVLQLVAALTAPLYDTAPRSAARGIADAVQRVVLVQANAELAALGWPGCNFNASPLGGGVMEAMRHIQGGNHDLARRILAELVERVDIRVIDLPARIAELEHIHGDKLRRHHADDARIAVDAIGVKVRDFGLVSAWAHMNVPPTERLKPHSAIGVEGATYEAALAALDQKLAVWGQPPEPPAVLSAHGESLA